MKVVHINMVEKPTEQYEEISLLKRTFVPIIEINYSSFRSANNERITRGNR